jgi:hypothetical protein
MTSELDPLIRELSALIAKEQDRKKFLELVERMNQLLKKKEERSKGQLKSP